MKYIIALLFLLFQLTVLAQSKAYAGNYEFYKGNNDNHYLQDKLILNPNGTFLFSSESYIEERMQRKRLQYGKGIWRSDKQLIFLKVENSDIDATHELNLNNTKLRYITKSPRDKSNRDIKTSVRIIGTEIGRLKGRILIKNADTNPIIQPKECCKSVWQVHSYLAGKWVKKANPNKQYHYTFKDEKGIFTAYEKNEEGVLKELNNGPIPFKIIRTDDGFQIEKDFGRLKITSGIKFLNDTKLITLRRDGKESELVRIKD